ncbi:XrtA/PEP-CTERM system-associated ATPase [Thiohalophilus thiocyanatoxydans]|uniref:Putative secretion ATPase (PEP-CTERM system associated) n=1 Tax=Thiohalophilus thiocyanatoxydans TaxID=381308 RepID=A0A4R8J0T7_9GAMM|nr:XrtA/PEP-CTERM system-associated ATPase [Thiohalophilus thiocyanatoxydans]TDY03779.1 putative secretion ATPase (PEP-CTERM system associated) [Thiohalophilus thiocyanatoxydans]
MYENYFKLDRKPFQLSPDPGFFFGSSIHKRALAYLRYGLTQAEGFIAITGDVGTGKTTLARMLFRELPPKEVIAAQIATTQLEADDLLRMVVQAFGLTVKSESKSALLEQLEIFLHKQAREGKRALLVVDEAQNLSHKALEELRMLSNFQTGDKPLLQSFLLGQNQFKRTLQHPDLEQLRQRFIAACHLTPLDEAETREYIEYRLVTAGWKNDPSITDEAFTDIFRHTKGIPRRINSLADRLLLFAYLEERHVIDPDAVSIVASELDEELNITDDKKVIDDEKMAITEEQLGLSNHFGTRSQYNTPARFQWDYLELRITAIESRLQILNSYIHRRFSEIKRKP